MSFRRMAGCAGILYVVLQLAAWFAYGDISPEGDASASEVAKYVADSGGYKVAGVLGALGVLLFPVFAVGFALPFLKTDQEHKEGYGVVMVAIAAVATALTGVGATAAAVLGLRIDEFNESSVRALWDLSTGSYSFSVLLLIPFGAAAAAAIMKYGRMPRWFGTFSAILALSGFTGIAGLASSGNLTMIIGVGYLVLLLWTLTAGFLMVRQQPAT